MGSRNGRPVERCRAADPPAHLSNRQLGFSPSTAGSAALHPLGRELLGSIPRQHNESGTMSLCIYLELLMDYPYQLRYKSQIYLGRPICIPTQVQKSDPSTFHKYSIFFISLPGNGMWQNVIIFVSFIWCGRRCLELRTYDSFMHNKIRWQTHAMASNCCGTVVRSLLHSPRRMMEVMHLSSF